MSWFDMHQVAIHSVPRSGSTWLGEIVNSSQHVKYCYQPLFSYALKDYLNLNSKSGQIDRFFAELYATNDDFILQKEARHKGALPSEFAKTDIRYIVYKEVRYHNLVRRILTQSENIKILMLIRNPLEVMASWVKAPKEFDASWSIDEELIHAEKKNQGLESNFYGLAKWGEVAIDFLKIEQDFQGRVLLVDYSKLSRNTANEVKTIFEFLGIPFEEQTLDFINHSQTRHNPDVYSVFKSKKSTDSWKTLFSEKQIKVIKDYTVAKQLERFL